MMWHHARKGLTARVFWGYLAVALVVAVASPGMAVFAADSGAPEDPVVAEPVVEPAPPVAEPVVEPVIEPAPAAEPIAEEPVAKPAPADEPVVAKPEPVVPASAPVQQPIVAAAAAEPERTPATEPVPDGFYRIDPVPYGTHTYTLGPATVTITVYDTPDGPLFDFLSSVPVREVRVKGGSDGVTPKTYTYDAPGVTSGTGLHAKLNTSSGKWFGLSHIDFKFGRLPEYEGRIKVLKYNDNHPTNGAYDDEPMLRGWEFVVKNAAGTEVARGTTGDDGTYTFRNLALGTYTVEEVLKSGWTNTTGLVKTVVLAAPTTAAPKSAECDDPDPIVVKAEVWFGNVRTPVYEGKIIVHKYNDNNPTNGVYNDEPMLEGWEFILYSDQHVELARGTTGPSGTFTFTGLALGTYYVEEVLEPGWINTTGMSQMVVLSAPALTKSAMTAGGPEPIVVEGHAWFGNVHETYEGKITVHKYNDNDPTNGAYDDEPMLEGWEFILYSDQHVELARGTTGADGTFTFVNLQLGTYYVQEVLMPGWVNTTGMSQTVVLSAPVYAGKYAEMAVGPRPVEVLGHAWFGNVHETYEGKIVVHKYHDNDPTNGEYDDEPMLEGWEFVLKDATGAEVARGTTGPDGTLTFSHLLLGTYTVEEILQDGWDNTTPLVQTLVLSAPVYAGIAERSVEPLPVEVVGHAWFGNVREVYTKSFELTYLHEPADLDAFRVSFYLNGDYHMLDLELDGGVYKASIEVPHPYEISGVAWYGHATGGWVWLGGSEARETLTGDLTNYFSYDPSISGHKFEDINGDSEWGEGEDGIAGWTIYLYQLPNPQVSELPAAPAGAVLVAQTLTDEDGYYRFDGMLPGLYWVAEEERPGWTPTLVPTEQPIWIGNDTHVTDMDFGNMRPAEKTFEFTFIDPPEGLSYWVRYWIEGESEPHELQLTEGDNPFSGSMETTVGTTLTSIEWFVISGDEEFVLGTTGPETIDEDMVNRFEYRSHIGGYKFDDEDGEGDWDAAEPAIGGWKITLFREVSSPPLEEFGASAIALIPVADTLTDGEGYYEFNGLLPGTYMVREEDREDWEMTLGPDGTFVVTNGTDRDDLIFGNTQFQPFTELDLAITKLASDHTPDPGDVVTYTLTYWNNGEIPAENYTIVDDYDERYMTPVNTAGGVVAGGKITWSLPGPLAAEDGHKTIVYTMRVDADMPDGTTNIDNDVVIDHPRDTNPDNNFDDERVRVRVGGEPFLPFTGGEFLMLLAAALVAAAAGVALRVRSARTE